MPKSSKKAQINEEQNPENQEMEEEMDNETSNLNNEKKENKNIPKINYDNIENEKLVDSSLNEYDPIKYKKCFLPQNDLAKQITLITLKVMLIKKKIKTLKQQYENTDEVYIINKDWYEKWKKYSRYGTLKRIMKLYEKYESKPIEYTPDEKSNPGIINNKDLMIRFKVDNNDGRNILVSKNNNSLDTRLNLKNNLKIMGVERFKLLNDYFKCDYILKGKKQEDKDNKSYQAFSIHLNISFLPTKNSYIELKEENYEEFKKKHNIIYDIYFNQTVKKSQIMEELNDIYKEKPEILTNMGIKLSSEKEDDILNQVKHLKYYVPMNENNKTKEEILNYILSKETIEKIKKDEQIEPKELNIECSSFRYNRNVSDIFNLNSLSIKDNIDNVTNGFIFVEYAPEEENDEKSDKNKNSIFKIVKKPKNHHNELAAYRGDSMDIDDSYHGHAIRKTEYNLDEIPINEKENKHGLVGLNNLGDTCYMNTGLQCLSNCELLTKYILGKYYEKDINKTNPIGSQGEIIDKYAKLITHIWYGNKNCLYPLQFKQAFGKVYQAFNDFRQQDSQEFISYLLDILHEDLNKVNNKPYIQEKDLSNDLSDEEIFKIKKELYMCRNQSFIADLIYGFYKSTVFCPNENCKNISKSFEPFSNISLSLLNESELRKIEEFKEEKNKLLGLKELSVYFIPFKINYKPLFFKIKIKKDMNIIDFRSKIEIVTGFYKNSFDIYKLQDNEFIHMKSDINLLNDFLKKDTRVYLIQIPPYVFGKENNYFDNIYEKLNRDMDSFYLQEEKYEGNDLYEEYNKDKKKEEKNVNEENNKINNDKMEEEEKKEENDDNKIDQNGININTNNPNNNENNNNIPESQQSTKINELIENEVEMEDKTIESLEIDRTKWIKAELYNYSYKYQPSEKEQIKEERIALPRIIYINKNWNNAELYECLLKILDGARPDMDEIKQIWFQDLKEITTSFEKLNKLEKNNLYESFNEKNTQPLMLQYSNIYNYDKQDNIKTKHEINDNSVVIYDTESFLIKNILEMALNNKENNLENIEILFKIIWKPNFASDYKEGIEPIIIEKSDKLEKIMTGKIEEEYFKKNNLDKNVKEKNEKKNMNLYELLNNFNQIEKLSKNNEWLCPKCKMNQLANKKIELYSISEIVIIHLKRFRNNKKIETYIDFPIENLDLTPYLPNKNEKYIYDLFAVANHVGGLHGGHYFAYCKNYIENEWYEFNDSNVDKIDKNKIVTENAYVLFYSRKRENKINEEELFKKPFINIDHTKYI